MEGSTGCKIAIRGKGSVKEGARGRRDGKLLEGDDEPLHVVIMGDEQANVDKAAKLIEDMLVVIDDDKNIHKQQQLRELALLNGTLKEDDYCMICAEKGHRQFECPKRFSMNKPAVQVKCAICGDSSHPTRDCTQKAELGQQVQQDQQQLDSDYLSFMAELDGRPKPTDGTVAGGKNGVDANAEKKDAAEAAVQVCPPMGAAQPPPSLSVIPSAPPRRIPTSVIPPPTEISLQTTPLSIPHSGFPPTGLPPPPFGIPPPPLYSGLPPPPRGVPPPSFAVPPPGAPSQGLSGISATLTEGAVAGRAFPPPAVGVPPPVGLPPPGFSVMSNPYGVAPPGCTGVPPMAPPYGAALAGYDPNAAAAYGSMQAPPQESHQSRQNAQKHGKKKKKGDYEEELTGWDYQSYYSNGGDAGGAAGFNWWDQ